MAPEAKTPTRSERPKRAAAESAGTISLTPQVTTPAPARPIPLKGRYIPGGPGGGGRYVDANGNEIPVGGTGPGGYNYIGPRGRIGRENLANGVIPPVYNRRDRDRARSQREPQTESSGARRTSTAASPAQNNRESKTQKQTPRPQRDRRPSHSVTMAPPSTAARAVAVIQGQGQAPREELGYELFHPDLDLDSPFLAIAADEVDGIPPRSLALADQSTNGLIANGLINTAHVADGAEVPEAGKGEGNLSPIASVNGESPAVQTPGAGTRRASRLPREQSKTHDFMTRTTGKVLTSATPNPLKTMGPIPNFTSKEKLNLPQPSYRKSTTLDRFEDKTQGNVKEGKLPYARYMDPSMVKVGYQKSDKWERPKGYIKGIDMTLEKDLEEGLLGPGRVEYDMDLQDEFWLEQYNATRHKEGFELITRELFEIVMTKIEVEWHALEKRFPKPNPKPPQTHRPRSSSAAAVNGEPQGEEQDSLCAICGDGDVENANAIVFCDGCDLAVHQECYGVPFIPEGQWLCRKCQLIGQGIATCLFCPSTEGAFKQTANSKWAHLLCALWIPEVNLGNTTFNEPVLDVEKIPNSRWKLLCYICNQRMGACIQCSNKSCYQAFHVSCADRARLYLKPKNPSGLEDGVKKSFCDKHCPADYAKEYDVPQALEQAKKYFERTMRGQHWAVDQETAIAMAATNQQAVNLQGHNSSQMIGPTGATESIKSSNQPQQSVSKMPSGAPIIPKYVYDLVEKSLMRFSIHKRKEFTAHACIYWTLKRESRRGAALLRRLRTSTDLFSSMEITRRNFAVMGPTGKFKLDRRIEFAQQLVKQLHQIQSISNDIVERESLKLQSAEAEVHMVDTTYFPVAKLLPPIVDKALGDDKHTFTASLETLRAKLKQRYYVSASTFTKDFCAMLQHVVNEEAMLNNVVGGADKDEKLALAKKKAHAKKILKAAQPMLEEAIRAEAELCGKVADVELTHLMHLLDVKWDAPAVPSTVDHDMGGTDVVDTSHTGVENVEVGTQSVEVVEEKADGDVVMSSGVEAEETINTDVVDGVTANGRNTDVVDGVTVNGQITDMVDEVTVNGKGKEVGSTINVSGPAGDSMSLDDAQPQEPLPSPPPMSVTTYQSSSNDRANALENGGIPWSVIQFEPEGTSLVQPKQPSTQYHDDLSDVDMDALGLDADGEPSVIVPGDIPTTPAMVKKGKAKKKARRR